MRMVREVRMASSFVSLADKGFWCPDSLLEMLASCLGEALRDHDSAWALQWVAHLSTQATAGLTGCIDLQLDGVAQHRDEIVSALSKIRSEIEQRPQRGSNDVEFAHLHALVAVTARLLDGRWPWSAGDAEALPSDWLRAQPASSMSE